MVKRYKFITRKFWKGTEQYWKRPYDVILVDISTGKQYHSPDMLFSTENDAVIHASTRDNLYTRYGDNYINFIIANWVRV